MGKNVEDSRKVRELLSNYFKFIDEGYSEKEAERFALDIYYNH